ncbi:hypothetical protein DM02DRAFT_647723 [Periconia macrospinosa]|uniref:Uncharacterized protein n=1 Tax=Periconia macrospinosa TaxID=97972 RepID=A0A2V1EGB6_9PLEO|nr:hypothetical protein DM02DRAFT_647723 [Periconia macrospinosa]
MVTPNDQSAEQLPSNSQNSETSQNSEISQMNTETINEIKETVARLSSELEALKRRLALNDESSEQSRQPIQSEPAQQPAQSQRSAQPAPHPPPAPESSKRKASVDPAPQVSAPEQKRRRGQVPPLKDWKNVQINSVVASGRDLPWANDWIKMPVQEGEVPWLRWTPQWNANVHADIPVLYQVGEDGRYNTLHLAPSKLGLTPQQDLGLCYGIYLTPPGSRHGCPYKDRPGMCMWNHNLTQEQLEFLYSTKRICYLLAANIVTSSRHHRPMGEHTLLQYPTLHKAGVAAELAVANRGNSGSDQESRKKATENQAKFEQQSAAKGIELRETFKSHGGKKTVEVTRTIDRKNPSSPPAAVLSGSPGSSSAASPPFYQVHSQSGGAQGDDGV